MTWLEHARTVLDRIEATQLPAIEKASQVFADAIGADGLVHMFGTGHSRVAVEEMFPRYGSFPGFHPIVELSLTYYTSVVGSNGQRQAMFLERVPGLAEVILSNFQVGPPDAALVISASGRNAAPVEFAIGARERGLTVVALTSVAQSTAEPPRHPRGRLLDHADIVLDMCTPPADAMCDVAGLDVPVGPGTTLAAVTLINSVKVRVAELLTERGAPPPVLASATVVGDARADALFDDVYAEHARRAGRALRTGAPRPVTHRG